MWISLATTETSKRYSISILLAPLSICFLRSDIPSPASLALLPNHFQFQNCSLLELTSSNIIQDDFSHTPRAGSLCLCSIDPTPSNSLHFLHERCRRTKRYYCRRYHRRESNWRWLSSGHLLHEQQSFPLRWSRPQLPHLALHPPIPMHTRCCRTFELYTGGRWKLDA
jgi:hypothetical protein